MEMLAGGALLLLAGLFTGEASRLHIAEFSTRSLLAMVYLTTLGSIVAFTAYIWLLKHVPATKVATYTYVNPIFAVILGWLILSEAITVATIAAAIIIILAVILITTGGRDRALVQRTTPGQARNPALLSRFMAEAPKSGQRGPLASPPSTLIASPAQIIPPGE